MSLQSLLWQYVRGDMPVSEFENLAYTSKELKVFLGEKLYFKVVSNQYSDEGATEELKSELRAFLRENFPNQCSCMELADREVLDMFHDIDHPFLRDAVRVVGRGDPYWWLGLRRCLVCAQHWLCAQEEMQNDIYCLARINTEEAQNILEKGVWPDHLDLYETLLDMGAKAGRTARWPDPLGDSSLADSMQIMASQRPGIELTRLEYVLNIGHELAEEIAKRVVNDFGVQIDFSK